MSFCKNTLFFHLHNMIGRASSDQSCFSARLRVASGREAEIMIRPFSGDLFILFEVLMDRCYHIPNTILPEQTVRVVLDCGANVGITALYLASRYPNARIFSIEPNDDNFELLMRNTEGEPRIIPIHGAVVGRPCESVRLTTTAPAWGNSITQMDGLEVPAFTIEQILTTHGLSHVDLLKVDIEGAEREVFANGQFMQKVGFVIIELHDGYSLEHFSRDVARWAFRTAAPKEHGELKMITACPAES